MGSVLSAPLPTLHTVSPYLRGAKLSSLYHWLTHKHPHVCTFTHTHTHTHTYTHTHMPESLFEAGPRNSSHSPSLREATSPPFSSLPCDYKVTALYKIRLGQITPHHSNLRSCLEPKWSHSQILGLMSLYNYLGTISPKGCWSPSELWLESCLWPSKFVKPCWLLPSLGIFH